MKEEIERLSEYLRATTWHSVRPASGTGLLESYGGTPIAELIAAYRVPETLDSVTVRDLFAGWDRYNYEHQVVD